MHIIDRAKGFVQSLWELANRSAWEWRRCPHCGSMFTHKWGTYERPPWSFEGRVVVTVQRHRCQGCRRTYSEQSAVLVRGSWYAREVHRYAVDQWQHTGSSLRRTAEWVRSWLGRQERYLVWRPWSAAVPMGEACHLSASTVHRWLDGAGRQAQRSVEGQLAGLVDTQVVGTDGLWARLRGGTKRVVLAMVDSVSGVIWPPVVVEGEETETGWQQMVERAVQAGLVADRLRGFTSDGSRGLMAYLKRAWGWVYQQRCVWHVWRGLTKELAAAVAEAGTGLAQDMAVVVRKQVRQELVALVHGVMDATGYEPAEQALARLRAYPGGMGLAQALNPLLDRLLMYRSRCGQGLSRVGPEWIWRDFRLRLSGGRNHGSVQRLERAALVWAIYHNFTPTQTRSERKRHYRHPGQSPLEVAGAPPGGLCYLDALGV